MIYIINIRENPSFIEEAADYFSSRWKIGKQVYIKSMQDSLREENMLPRWYLMIKERKLSTSPPTPSFQKRAIIGGFGLVENDFMVRKDLSPWFCALYVEPEHRGQGNAQNMLSFARYEAKILGFNKVYLNTDHIGFYEQFDWEFIGFDEHSSGDMVRVYAAETI
ncbi:MAG: GNAT family N-acetyltransferase [Candidatus Cloacimonetes bacterium]|nr:GNAT family N-acetyltransferase [Candidatus Cloacimonadota bacterium]